ncbi:MAG: helix-turn-helix transcriptional regulator [Armatimonadetes bacterium]|nr:helix-turn-helix transcriptional regulator [Armatimonadota bacterium]
MVRYHKASLAQLPELRTCGAFGDEADRTEWVQPSDAWQGLLFHNSGTFTMNGTVYPLEPFDLFIVPPTSRCTVVRSGSGVTVYDYFTFVPSKEQRDIVGLPVRSSLGGEGHFWDIEFRKCLNRLQFSRTSSNVLVWSLLWSVAQPEHVALKSVYTEDAQRIMESRMSERLRIADVCAELHVSQSQLNRHFLSDLGRTPHQFLADCRAIRAHHLLTTTTDPIKQVAAACGIPNVQQFNRFVNLRFGIPPRELRKRRGIVDVFRTGDLDKARGKA